MECQNPKGLDGELSAEKEEVGEQLFLKVASLDSQLCAQVTGMLLELELPTLRHLLNNPRDLETAVFRARDEYIHYTLGASAPTVTKRQECDTHESSDSSCCEEKENVAETLYDMLVEDYPDHAAKLTGMLLELDAQSLQHLMKTPRDLKIKVQLALEALRKADCS